MLVQELELEGARPLSAPGVDEPVGKEEDSEVALEPDAAASYRALAARCNYIAVGRADAQFAIKELCRDMANPVASSWARLIRLGRYVLGRPRAVILFGWQPYASIVDVFTDANWAGCRTARKTTSGESPWSAVAALNRGRTRRGL